ncbi:sterol desaturase family protein [Parasphingorhabdus sp. DH2-15]|uniref:sterol desaturase family protein n=1 Tax=Parasphingorhabdus sp. DH2-15 TaxID=3444112 RepID=UPI003F6890B5
MRPEIIVILCILTGYAFLEGIRGSFFRKKDQTRDDAIVELFSTFGLFFISQPLIILSVQFIMGSVAPQWQDSLAGLPFWAGFALFIIFDDLTQYWWHRASHSFPWLYNLHRAHHNAKYMSVRLVYRNNFFYYAMMPSIWLSATLVYLGLGWVYAVFIVIKLAIITGAHSDVAWDKPLYKIKWLSPIMWVVERTISTPATHHAHHGRHSSDGVTHYKGNFGNMFFLWDVIFGTAKITRNYPKEFGVENLAPATLGQQLAWPLFAENDKGGLTAAQEANTRN